MTHNTNPAAPALEPSVVPSTFGPTEAARLWRLDQDQPGDLHWTSGKLGALLRARWPGADAALLISEPDPTPPDPERPRLPLVVTHLWALGRVGAGDDPGGWVVLGDMAADEALQAAAGRQRRAAWCELVIGAPVPRPTNWSPKHDESREGAPRYHESVPGWALRWPRVPGHEALQAIRKRLQGENALLGRLRAAGVLSAGPEEIEAIEVAHAGLDAAALAEEARALQAWVQHLPRPLPLDAERGWGVLLTHHRGEEGGWQELMTRDEWHSLLRQVRGSAGRYIALPDDPWDQGIEGPDESVLFATRRDAQLCIPRDDEDCTCQVVKVGPQSPHL